MGILTTIFDAVKSEWHDYNTNQLVHQAYSHDPAIRTLARARLKQKDPDIYSMLEEMPK
jgi:hypothetical protein